MGFQSTERVPTFYVKMFAESYKWKSRAAVCFQRSVSQSAITCSKLIIETLEQGVNYVQS